MDGLSPYPLRLEGDLPSRLSRWLWLVKWFLVIPHVVVLFFLWIAFFVVSVVAFFAILFTGRYPRGIFDFNVGVLRWTWRVGYYSYSALGTDAYPPFTLADSPDYPARLSVAYPQQLSRGLALVKWWLLALPQYLIIGVFTGGAFAGYNEANGGNWWYSSGLIGLLVFIAGVALLFAALVTLGIHDRPSRASARLLKGRAWPCMSPQPTRVIRCTSKEPLIHRSVAGCGCSSGCWSSRT